MTWRDAAACKQMPTIFFFPERGEDTRFAKAVCRACPVRDECLAANLAEKFGIFGGMSERERRALRRLRVQQEAA